MSNFQSFKVYQIKSAIQQWIEKNQNVKLPGWKSVSKDKYSNTPRKITQILYMNDTPYFRRKR